MKYNSDFRVSFDIGIIEHRGVSKLQNMTDNFVFVTVIPSHDVAYKNDKIFAYELLFMRTKFNRREVDDSVDSNTAMVIELEDFQKYFRRYTEESLDNNGQFYRLAVRGSELIVYDQYFDRFTRFSFCGFDQYYHEFNRVPECSLNPELFYSLDFTA